MPLIKKTKSNLNLNQIRTGQMGCWTMIYKVGTKYFIEI